MMRTFAVATAVLLLLAACGSAETNKAPAADKQATTGTASVGACAVDSEAVTAAKTVARVDLDGDGGAEAVKLTAAGGKCPSLLFAKQGDGYVVTRAALPAPPVASAFGVAVPGEDAQLLVTRQDHPRGGFQLRVYAAGDGTLTELKHDGATLFPFVATDVEEHPASIDCADDGIVVTEAVPHEPVGIAPAWDVRQTTYTLGDGKVTAGPTKEVADNVLPKQLAGKYPDLVKHSAFTSCRA
jgi:hypothetical protein